MARPRIGAVEHGAAVTYVVRQWSLRWSTENLVALALVVSFATTHRKGAGRRERTVWAAARGLVFALAAWVAGTAVAGITLSGPLVRQLLACLTVAVLAVVILSTVELFNKLLGHAPGRLRKVIRGFEGTALVLGILPLVLWLGSVVGGLLDLPLRVDGFWPLVAGAVVMVAAGGLMNFLVAAVRRLELRHLSRRRAVAGAVRLWAGLLALWLAVTVVPGVRLDDGEWWRVLLALLVLTALFTAVKFSFHITATVDMYRWWYPPLLVAYMVVTNLLMFGLVWWFGGMLEPALRIDGPAGFAVASPLCTAVMWLAHLPFLFPLLRTIRREGLTYRRLGERAVPVELEISRFGVGPPSDGPLW
jgi:hypothetical protein